MRERERGRNGIVGSNDSWDNRMKCSLSKTLIIRLVLTIRFEGLLIPPLSVRKRNNYSGIPLIQGKENGWVLVYP